MKSWDREKVALPARRKSRVARDAIAKNLRGDGFARLWEMTPPMPTKAGQIAFKKLVGKREVETPAAVMPDKLNAKGRNLAWLSQQTIGKIKAHHPLVAAADMRIAQKAVDGADVFRQSARYRIGFARDAAGVLWAAYWKRIAGGKIYITGIRRASRKELQRAAEKWRRDGKRALGRR